MSKIAVASNASGTATFTIQSPATNTDRVLTLPDEAGTVLTSGSSASSIPGYGNQIIAHSQFRLTSNLVAPDGNINTSNFEEVDDALYSGRGSPVSLSGVNFVFDVTGIYLCLLSISGEPDSDSAAAVRVFGSSDGGSNYDQLASANFGSRDTAGEVHSANSQFIVNVTDTSNFRVKLDAISFSAQSELFGNSDYNRTSIAFIRLGDAV